MTDPVRFILPPSLGEDRAGSIAERLGSFLSDRLGRKAEVTVASDYAAIEDELLFGSADAAWGPPFVCARLQAAGGRFLLHAVRRGASRYRSGMVCRQGDVPSFDDVTGLRAAWVSPDSTAGYLLPRQWLRDRGIDADSDFVTVRFLGSYKNAVNAVLQDEADVTAVFASVEGAEREYSALDELGGEVREKLEIFAFTAERLNDGIVMAPDCDRALLEELRDLLRTAHTVDGGPEILLDVFNAEQFVATQAAAYQAVYDGQSESGEPPPNE